MTQELRFPDRMAGIPIIRRLPGIPPEMLISHGSLIKETIKGLKPVSAMESVGIKARSTTKTADVDDLLHWWWKYGGMKITHLHYAGEAYVLNEEQWQRFTSVVLKDFSKKLAGAKSVSFDKFVEVADAIADVG